MTRVLDIWWCQLIAMSYFITKIRLVVAFRIGRPERVSELWKIPFNRKCGYSSCALIHGCWLILIALFFISEKWKSIFKLYKVFILSFQLKHYKTFSLDISFMRENKTRYLQKTVNIKSNVPDCFTESFQAKLVYFPS